jgi:TonB family protein
MHPEGVMEICLATATMKRLFGSLALILACCLFAAGQSPTPTPTEKPTPEAKPAPSPAPQPNNVAASPTGEPSKATPPQSKPDASKPPVTVRGGMEILSDTMGVDFGPYMKRLHVQIEKSWFPLIPRDALPPMMKAGEVVIELAIMKDGSVQGVKIVRSSGDTSLDRAAYGAISNAAPLTRLPAEFSGQFLVLRCSFLYNPAKQQEKAPASDKN